jgi:hypothetical protein
MRCSTFKTLVVGAVMSTGASAQSPGDPSLNPSGKYTIVPKSPPLGSGLPVGASFVSYSIEWAHFPDYAGNKSQPNDYSENLLNNIAAYQGAKPVIRVGGETQ